MIRRFGITEEEIPYLKAIGSGGDLVNYVDIPFCPLIVSNCKGSRCIYFDEVSSRCGGGIGSKGHPIVSGSKTSDIIEVLR